MSVIAINPTDPQSVFHEGEIYIQREAHVQSSGQFIHKFMPDQHRDFFETLPIFFVGTLDSAGQPWASPIFGAPGFVRSPNNTELVFDGYTALGDVIRKNLANNDASVGMLGIEIPTRRRNRANGRIAGRIEEGEGARLKFRVNVHQSFGNCPKYIQRRQWKVPPTFSPAGNTTTPDSSQSTITTRLSPSDIAFIQRADSFYIATASRTPSSGSQSHNQEGIDLSTRGGLPGFVGVKDPLDGTSPQRIAWPDYQGNNYFNTLGNIHVNPRTGLLFIDFVTGDLLQVVGRGRIVFAGDEGWDDEEFNGVNALEQNPQQRKVIVEVERVVRHPSVIPFQWGIVEYSPYNLPVRGFDIAKSTTLAPGVRVVECVDVLPESHDVRTFVFRTLDGKAVDHVAGGYAMFDFKALLSLDSNRTDDLVRTWTVSSAPGGSRGGLGSFEITVKRVPNGLVSVFLHEKMIPGVKIRLLGTEGDFTFLDSKEEREANRFKNRKVLLLAAGIGITPFASALRTIAREKIAPQIPPYDVTLIYCSRTQDDLIFHSELSALARESTASAHKLTYVPTVTGEASDTVHVGRVTEQFLADNVADLGERDVYICGPGGFTSAMEEAMQRFKVPGRMLHKESFTF